MLTKSNQRIVDCIFCDICKRKLDWTIGNDKHEWHLYIIRCKKRVNRN